jgi:prefoldin beta subunit
MSGVIEARQRLDSQLQENELVLKVSHLYHATASSDLSTALYLLSQKLPISGTRANNQEFTLLKDHNTIYKLIGPALVPQDQNEAKSNVEKRLEFIRSEMYVFSTPVKCPSRIQEKRG